MRGVIKLFTSSGVYRSSCFFYSKKGCRTLYDLWVKKYEDHIIHICPEADFVPEKVINIKKPVINKVINMDDFKQIGPFRHETYYHRCYCRGEK